MPKYSISIGVRKALWQAAYLGIAAAVDTFVNYLTGSTEAKTWPVYPIVVAGLTLLGNYLRTIRTTT